MSLIGTCGLYPAGKPAIAFSPTVSCSRTISSTAFMPSLGSTPADGRNRSGWSRSARTWCSPPEPISAISMPWWSISASVCATGSDPASIAPGTFLNMYCAGNSNSSFEAVSFRFGARNS